MHFPGLLLLLFITLFSLPTPSTSSLDRKGYGDIHRWCETTPHPEPCVYYLTHSRHPDPPRHRSDFYRLSVKLALGLAVRAQSHLQRLGRRYRTIPKKTAWLDCWRLYGNTVLQLNRTINPTTGGCTAMDAQTWLSAALTDLETCRKGFRDLKVSSKMIEPVMRYNISELVSNCLAINKPAVTGNLTASSPRMTAAAGRRLLQLSAQADVVVAKDGSGKYSKINDALNAAGRMARKGRLVIYVKAGVYAEYVQIVSSLENVTMVGDGIGKTIITGSRSVARLYTTFSSPTFSVFGDGFIASGITFRNTYGPGSQAVALLSGSDRSIFYRCSFEGYQDTLCVYTQRQFYRECDIYGTIDVIFGNAAVVLQNCNIYARRPQRGESTVITAQGRTDQNQNTGIVIQFSKITTAPDFGPVYRRMVKAKSYLGRPWQQYSRTLYLQNSIDSFIDPAGWLPFKGNFALNTLYYAEFRNTGPGSKMQRRVKWQGYHVIVRPSLVKQFTVARFIDGGTWIRSAGVPFTSGL